MLARLRQELNEWLQTVWFQLVLMVTIVVLLAVVALAAFVDFDHAAQIAVDPVPMWIGVVLLGVIVVACVAGLLQVINNPEEILRVHRHAVLRGRGEGRRHHA